MIQIEDHEGHTMHPDWAGKVSPEDCVYEARARCRLCKEGQFVHFTEQERKEWYTKHGGEHWVMAYFKEDLEWDIESGVCGACVERIRLMGRIA